MPPDGGALTPGAVSTQGKSIRGLCRVTRLGPAAPKARPVGELLEQHPGTGDPGGPGLRPTDSGPEVRPRKLQALSAMPAHMHTRSETQGSKKQDNGLTAQRGAELGPNLGLRAPDTAVLPMTGPASSPWHCGSVYPVAAGQNPHRGGPEPWVQTPIRQLNNSDKTQKSLGSMPSPGQQRHSRGPLSSRDKESPQRGGHSDE